MTRLTITDHHSLITIHWSPTTERSPYGLPSTNHWSPITIHWPPSSDVSKSCRTL